MRNLWVNLLMITVMTTGTVTAQHATYKTIELRPIQKQGWRYYYDFKKVTTAEALQIPLIAMEDEQIQKYYNSYVGLQTAAGLVLVVPVLYILYGASNQYYSPDSFWTITITSFAASLALQIWSHNRMKLAIERYNTLLLPPPSGSVAIPNGGLRLSFRL